MRKYHIGIALITFLLLTYLSFQSQWLYIIDDLNLIFHEAGHTIFSLFGETIHFLSGSLMQVAIPCVLAISFFRKRSYIAFCIMTWWAGESMMGVARYVADARLQQLELIGGEHDFAVLFAMHPKLFPYDVFIGSWIRALAAIIMVASIAAMVYFIYRNKEHVQKTQ